MPADPYGIEGAPPVWSGAWPPDPSWDDPSPPILPAPPESPVPDIALEAPPMPPPDAVSGAGAPPAPQLTQGLAAATAAPGVNFPQGAPADPPGWQDFVAAQQPPEQAPGGGEPWDADLIDMGDEEVTPPDLADPYPDVRTPDEVAGMSPDDLATYKLNRELDAQDAALQKKREVDAEHRKWLEDNEKMRTEAVAAARQRSAEVSAEADRLANEKVDPDGWQNSRSLFQKIAMFAAGIVGGMVQSRTGGPNQGLQMIQGAIERHIAAQKENLAHRRTMNERKRMSLAEQTAQDEADRRSAAAFEQGAYQRAIGDIETDMQQFDPAGTRAIKNRELIFQLKGARDAAALKDYEWHRNDMITVGDHNLKVAADRRAELTRRAAAANAAASRKRADEERLYQRGQDEKKLNLEYAKLDASGQAKKDERALKQAEDVRDLSLSGPRGVLTRKDGTPYLMPKGSADEGYQKMASAAEVSSVLDEILKLRDDVGGEASEFNSDQAQRYKVLQARVALIAKSGTHGMSSDADMAKLADSMGAADVASFRARAAGLEKARERTATELNTWLKARNYDGEPISFPSERQGATETPDQREFHKLMKSETGAKGQSIPTAAIAANPFVVGPARALESAVRGENAALAAGDEKNQIDQWIAEASAPEQSASRDERRKFLRELGRSAKSPAVRAYAQAAIQSIFNSEVKARDAGEPFVQALEDTAVQHATENEKK